MTLINKIISGIVVLFGILLYTFSLGKRVQKSNNDEKILDNVATHKKIENAVGSAYDDDIRSRVRDNYTRK